MFMFSLVAPYDPHLSSRESLVKAFWVHTTSNPGTQTFSLPMELSYNIEPSGLLTDDLLTEMVRDVLTQGLNPVRTKPISCNMVAPTMLHDIG